MKETLIHYSITDKIRIRYQLWRYINPFIRKRINVPDKTIKDNIYLFTLPRSGSTWLAELLLNIQDSFLIDEPLWSGNIGSSRATYARCDEVKKLGFYFIQPIPQKADWPEAEEFFSKLLKVQVGKYGLFMEGDLHQLLNTETFIFKFCYGNLLLPWLIDKFQIKPIFLIRHPCAVVHSQMNMPHFNYILKQPEFIVPDFRFSDCYKKYDHILKTIKYPEENLAAHWAISNHYLVTHPYNNDKWLTVAYENVYANFDEEIERIFNWIHKPVPVDKPEHFQCRMLEIKLNES